MSVVIESPREQQLRELDRLIRRDPGRRGLIDSEAERRPLCPDHLAATADHLARFGREVWLITGFYIPAADPPAAETDGPPGTALLAAILAALGMQPRVLTDQPCAAAVSTAVQLYGLTAETVVVSPVDMIDDWVRELLQQSPALTHVIAIERVGPSHTPETIGGLALDHPAADDYRRLVAPADWNRCHNMRGQDITSHTAPLHRVLEIVTAERPGVRTIGIGDGGNELGMGAIPWSELAARLTGPAAPIVPCRVATDWTILSGTSNWGAQALAAAVAICRDRAEVLAPWTAAREEELLTQLVERGPAVDGVTRLPLATVDGLPFVTYIQPWTGMRRVAGL